MDRIQRAFFSLHFENQYLRSKGDIFQELFRRIMELAYPGDFVAVRPHGNLGDLKCDGYRMGTGTLFQCYGPKGMELAKLTAKMDEDFHGAVKHWGKQMKSWVFVHNDEDGLPAPPSRNRHRVLPGDARRRHTPTRLSVSKLMPLARASAMAPPCLLPPNEKQLLAGEGGWHKRPFCAKSSLVQRRPCPRRN